MAHLQLSLEDYYFNLSAAALTDEARFEGRHVFHPEDIFFQGHFPGDPVVPGVVMIKGMLCAGRRLAASLNLAVDPHHHTLKAVRFKKVMKPLDEVRFTAGLAEPPSGDEVRVLVSVFKEKLRVAQGEISFQKKETKNVCSNDGRKG